MRSMAEEEEKRLELEKASEEKKFNTDKRVPSLWNRLAIGLNNNLKFDSTKHVSLKYRIIQNYELWQHSKL